MKFSLFIKIKGCVKFMSDKEILGILNSINYDSEELEELEKNSLLEGDSIGESLYKVQNDKVLKDIAFFTLEQKVKSLLNKDEEIKYKTIVLQSYLEKEIFLRDIGAFGAKSAVYIGLFITDKRLFSFRMDTIYNVLDEYSNGLSNLKSLSDLWSECETIGFKFNDDKEILPRPFGKENKELFLTIIKYLKEKQNLEFEKYKGPKKNTVYWIFVGMGVLAGIVMITIFGETIKSIIEALKNLK